MHVHADIHRALAHLLLGAALVLGGCEKTPTTPADGAPVTPEHTTTEVRAASLDASDKEERALVDWEAQAWETFDELEIRAPVTLWEEDGIELSMQPWRIAESRGVAWRAKLTRAGSFARVLAASDVQPFKAFLAPDDGPRVMINGGFYEESKEASRRFEAMGVVRASGQDHQKYRHRGGSGIFAVGPSGMSIVHRSAWKDIKGKQTTDALQSIDRIVDEGEALVTRRDAQRQAARSAIALTADAIWIVVVAGEHSIRQTEDGATLLGTSYQGMPLWAFSRYIKESTQAQQALNLDGAISTQLEVRTGSHSFSIRGERGTINAVEFRPPRK